MWVSSVMLIVKTQNSPNAGTDDLITATITRDGKNLVTLNLDWPTEDDLEPGAQRAYTYFALPRHNDKTPQLPDGIGQSPMPYPDHGLEYSNGLPGHMKVVLKTKGDDLWIKDEVQMFVRQTRQKATSFDTLAWIEDSSWSFVASWGQDVRISAQSSDQGHSAWTMNV